MVHAVLKNMSDSSTWQSKGDNEQSKELIYIKQNTEKVSRCQPARMCWPAKAHVVRKTMSN